MPVSDPRNKSAGNKLSYRERSLAFSNSSSLCASGPSDSSSRCSRAYIRFTVADRPGVLAEITAAMRDAKVSIESLIQKGRNEEGGEVLVAMVTHEGPESAVAEALRLLEGSASLTAPPLVMHILGA